MEQHKHTIRVIAAVVDQQQLTLYKEDGDVYVIPQGDPRLADVLRFITPVLAEGTGEAVEVEIENPISQDNPYQDYETRFGGVRFFKMAKTKLATLFQKAAQALGGAGIVGPQILGPVPIYSSVAAPPTQHEHEPKEDLSEKAQKFLDVSDEIIAHAKPSHHPEFHDKDTGEKDTETIVAVIGNEVVSDVQKLRPQLSRAVQKNSAKGVQAFMERAAAVATQRRHSVEDLLRFMERGDLPIADDGTIVIYKVLRRHSQLAGAYVDCHTMKIVQRVGSYVCMDPSLVDHDRTNECSNGLHVARRAYVGNFSGDVVVLAKVRPEDVIAVPSYDANKMRVCGYHILFELSPESQKRVCANQPFTDNDVGRFLLGRALSGDHPTPIEEVRVTSLVGPTTKITSLSQLTVEPQPKKEVQPEEALPEPGDEAPKAPLVDPKKVIKEVAEVKANIESRAEKARRLYTEFDRAKTKPAQHQAAQVLIDHKRAVKLSWQSLGITSTEVEKLSSAVEG